MDLWIRTQDKKKLCVAKFFVLDNDETGIFCYNGESYSIFAGKYKTKKRALEVLDEIQNLIQPPMNFIVSQHIDFDNDGEGLIGCNILKEEPKIEKISDEIVYQMPKE